MMESSFHISPLLAIGIYHSVPGKCPWALNHKHSFFTILGTLPGVLDAYSVQQLKEAGSIIMGVALARYTHVRICTLYIEHDF